MDPATIGAIVSGGASLLGKLFGGGEEKTSTTIDYKDMVKKAEAAGFNPLTAIRNGGSAGFTTTTHPALSAGEFIAGAVADAAPALASLFDPHREADAARERAIRDAYLENLRADTAARNRASIGGVPVSAGQSVVSKPPNLFTAWTDNSAAGGNRTIWLPNADLPEAEQMLVPSFGAVGNDIVRGAGAVTGPGGSSTPRPVVPPLKDGWTLGDALSGIGSVVDWWNSKANADYARHKAQN